MQVALNKVSITGDHSKSLEEIKQYELLGTGS